jgi:cytochrome c oxidase subunit 4
MTLADYRKTESAEVEAHEGEHGGSAHPSALEYIQIGVILAIVTAVEVALYYIDIDHDLLVVMLILLSALKFALVVLWFMHLKFDNRIFSTAFTGGFLLALSIFVVVIATLGGKLV